MSSRRCRSCSEGEYQGTEARVSPNNSKTAIREQSPATRRSRPVAGLRFAYLDLPRPWPLAVVWRYPRGDSTCSIPRRSVALAGVTHHDRIRVHQLPEACADLGQMKV